MVIQTDGNNNRGIRTRARGLVYMHAYAHDCGNRKYQCAPGGLLMCFNCILANHVATWWARYRINVSHIPMTRCVLSVARQHCAIVCSCQRGVVIVRALCDWLDKASDPRVNVSNQCQIQLNPSCFIHTTAQ